MAVQRRIGKGILLLVVGLTALVMGILSYLGQWSGVPPGWVPGVLAALIINTREY